MKLPCYSPISLNNAQNPLDTFPRNFRVDGEVVNLLRTCYEEADVMDFGLNLAPWKLSDAEISFTPVSPQQVRNKLATSP